MAILATIFKGVYELASIIASNAMHPAKIGLLEGGAIEGPESDGLEGDRVAARSGDVVSGKRRTHVGRQQAGSLETIAVLVAGFVGADDLAGVAFASFVVARIRVCAVVAAESPRQSVSLTVISFDCGSCGGKNGVVVGIGVTHCGCADHQDYQHRQCRKEDELTNDVWLIESLGHF